MLWFWGFVGAVSLYALVLTVIKGAWQAALIPFSFLAAAAFTVMLTLRSGPLVATSAGLETRQQVIPWSQVRTIRTFRSSRPVVHVRHTGGSILSLWTLNQGLDDAIDEVGAHWRASGTPVTRAWRFPIIVVLYPEPMAAVTE